MTGQHPLVDQEFLAPIAAFAYLRTGVKGAYVFRRLFSRLTGHSHQADAIELKRLQTNLAVRWNDHWRSRDAAWIALNIPLEIEIYNFGVTVFKAVLKIDLPNVRTEKWDYLWSFYFESILISPTHTPAVMLEAIRRAKGMIDLNKPPTPIVWLPEQPHD